MIVFPDASFAVTEMVAIALAPRGSVAGAARVRLAIVPLSVIATANVCPATMVLVMLPLPSWLPVPFMPSNIVIVNASLPSGTFTR